MLIEAKAVSFSLWPHRPRLLLHAIAAIRASLSLDSNVLSRNGYGGMACTLPSHSLAPPPHHPSRSRWLKKSLQVDGWLEITGTASVFLCCVGLCVRVCHVRALVHAWCVVRAACRAALCMLHAAVLAGMAGPPGACEPPGWLRGASPLASPCGAASGGPGGQGARETADVARVQRGVTLRQASECQ